MKLKSFGFLAGFTPVIISIMISQASAAAVDNQESPAEIQRKLIGVLQSDAPPAEKAITCKQLVVWGTKDAVPSLKPLLADPALTSWARTALEAIPDPAASEALREAMGKLQGRILIGVINSLGVLQDAKAVDGLVAKLNDSDAGVVAAAAAALGKIGGETAARSLLQALDRAPASARPEVAESCIVCADNMLARGQDQAAIGLYDAVRKASVPKNKYLEATRGAILARKAGGVPMLVELLRSSDKGLFGLGLRVARELAVPEATKALSAELERANPDRQALLVLALADRNDPGIIPAMSNIARNGSRQAKLVALSALERVGNAACVPVLLEAATGDDAELARTAKGALIRLPDKEVDKDIITRLATAAGKTRQTLIELAGQRQIIEALPAIVRSAANPDAGVRSAAVGTIGAIGDEQQAGSLVQLLQRTGNPEERGDIEKALLAISSRRGASCLQYFLPLAKSSDAALRKIALHALASIGGSTALGAVKSAIDDPDETVQDEAVRTLSTWASNWPDDTGVAEPLLALAKSSKKMAYQVQGLRGYLQYLQEDKKLSESEKTAKVNEVLPLINRPEEKRLAIAVLGTIPAGGALEMLVTIAADQAIAEEAYLAVVTLASKNDLKDATKELRQRSLQLVVDKTKTDRTKQRAETALRRIK